MNQLSVSFLVIVAILFLSIPALADDHHPHDTSSAVAPKSTAGHAHPIDEQMVTEADPTIAYFATQTAEERIRAAVEYLASPKLEGRRTGTNGADLACDYLEQVLTAMGAKPLPGQRSMKQGFSLTKGISIIGQPELKIRDVNLVMGEDFTVAEFSGSGMVDNASVVFAGYGIDAPELNYHDYQELDVEGKVVIVVRGEPLESKPDSKWADSKPSLYSDLKRKAALARDLGASAILIVENPLISEEDTLPELRPAFSAANFDIPALFIKRDVLNKLLGPLFNLEVVLSEIDSNLSPDSKTYPDESISINLEVEKELATGFNVNAVIPAANQSENPEYITVGAHYDHLGIGGPESLTPSRYGEVHAGADDNASGVAMVLEIAQWASKNPTDHDRDILITLFSGEELGLLGSQAIIRQPPVELESIKYMLNFDMVGSLRGDQLTVGSIESSPDFTEIVESPATAMGFKLAVDTSGMGASDHVSFLREGIPAMFFFTGVSPNYHTPDDTPEKLNYSGMVRISKLIEGIITRSDDPVFELAFNPETKTAPSQGRNRGNLKVTMGTIPHYSGDTPVEGMGVGDTVPGGPAEIAGILSGDVIVKILDRKIANIYDFIFVLQDCQAGQVVPVTVVRGDETLVLDVTLDARNVER